LSSTIGRIRIANEVIVPINNRKIEAPYSVELFWQIKVFNLFSLDVYCYYINLFINF